jgi:hypothetical protein
MVWTAYYDESGTHGGDSPATVLAGMVGRTEDWRSLEREWQKVLRKYGLPHFHAKHLFHRTGEHKGWDLKKSRHCWADFLYVMQERDMFISETVLRKDDYIRSYLGCDLPKTSRKERLDSRYALCVRSLLHSLTKLWGSRYLDDEMNFVFESGHKNEKDALRVFDETKQDEDLGYMIGSMSFGRKKEFCALQAADMLAYWAYRDEVKPGMTRDDKGVHFVPEQEMSDAGLGVFKHQICR